MVPMAWKLIQKEEKGTQTMPPERLKRGRIEQDSESEAEENKRMKKDEVDGAIQVEHLETSEETENESFIEIHREMCETYDEMYEGGHDGE